MNGCMELGPPNWWPLETSLRESGRPVSLCAAFMWMWRDRGIEFYKHIDSRGYLLLDSERRCWRQGDGGVELSDFEREFRRVTEWGMTNGDTKNAGAGANSKPGRWIGDISAERVDNLWRSEDHEAVIHNLRAADRLTTQVVEFAAREAVEQFQKASKGRMTMEANPKLNIRGLRLPPPAVKRLGQTGIFARPEVSLEYQSLSKRYVVRGVESGGAVAELGRYVTFAGENGEQLSWLQPIDSLAVNGVHAVVVAPAFTRVEMFRMGRTYELVITKHRPSAIQHGSRPKLLAEEVFRGANGYLGLELWGKDKALAGTVLPQFFTRAGEEIEIPAAFISAAKALTAAVNAIACTSSCYLTAPTTAAAEPACEMVDRAESTPEVAATAG
jgi:hypothetical protein